jgi:hypothetical protein
MVGVDPDNLTLRQRIVLKLTGRAYVGHYAKPNWRGKLPFYVVRCKKHGLYVTYPQGYDGNLLCPRCWEESMER